MMIRDAIAMLLLACAASAQMPASIPASEIDEAIKLGMEKKDGLVYRAGEGSGSFSSKMAQSAGVVDYAVRVQGPRNRIQSLAAVRARKYLAFSRDSLTEIQKSSVVAVRVEPGQPQRRGREVQLAEKIEHVVVQRSGKQTSGDPWPILQPISIEKDQVTWSNLYGATFSGEAFTAYFDLSSFGTDDFDIVVINAKMERRFHLELKDLRSIE